MALTKRQHFFELACEKNNVILRKMLQQNDIKGDLSQNFF